MICQVPMKGFLDGSIKHPGHGWLLEALLEVWKNHKLWCLIETDPIMLTERSFGLLVVMIGLMVASGV